MPASPVGPADPGPPTTPPPKGGPRGESFPKLLKLRRASEFQRVLKSGWRRTTEHLVVHVMPNQLEVSRLGLIISRKVGDAVRRNRIRRRLRESFRRNLRQALAQSGQPCVDLVVRPLPGAAPVPQAQLQAEILAALDAWRARRPGGGGNGSRGPRHPVSP